MIAGNRPVRSEKIGREYRIRTRPLFGEAVRFTIGSGARRRERVH